MKADLKRTLFRYSVSRVSQGKHKFYTLTMPSDILAETCFVSTRDEDPKAGFQRILDRKRAEQIAEYIDTGLGTIPNSIVLSAQPEADLKIIGGGKTLQFKNHPKAFLILDGQHRVYGFHLAKTALRVPVVIYNGLSRKDESRLFIDINTKQRPVPNELLLDIKRLADYENDNEALLRDIYDLFNADPSSPLIGMLSPSTRSRNKISRVTFNAATKPLIFVFASKTSDDLYVIIANYLHAFTALANGMNLKDVIVNPVVFRAVMLLFIDVAQRVQDRFGKVYVLDNFLEILTPLFERIKPNILKRPGSSYKALHEELSKLLRVDFSL